MLCDVCKEGIEGIWDPSRTKRVGKFEELAAQWGSSIHKPRDGFAKYWSSLSEDRDDLADLEPSECLFIHHKTATSFTASMHSGCAICNESYEWKNINIPSWLQEHEEDSECYVSVFKAEIDLKNDSFSIRILAKTDCGINSSFVNIAVKGDFKPDRNINYEFETSTNSARTWSIIDGWMKECTESHQRCQQPELTASYRPTRLLEMNESKSFRLIQGSECPAAIRYAALSYCWGPKVAHGLLRLLRSTASGLREWRPVGGLPKTFRDAMNIAQRLGVHYLWIDRLCILQDSAEDWRHEASTMQDVYRNAYIGIGALSAKDDEGGCFFERDPAKVGPTVLSLKMKPDGTRMDFRYVEGRFTPWRYTFKHEPLSQRSWVVQERLLARRTLYFGSKQVFWECRAGTCCEMHPKGMDPYGGKAKEAPDEQLWKQLLATRQNPCGGPDRPQLFFDWDAIVEYYASLQLTMASDKLVALSGLANDMKRRLNELQPGPHRYLAGLWEDEMINQLTWQVEGPAKRASPYRAPSWSWACLDGNVVCSGTRYGQLYDIASMISAKMVYLGKEETGEVKSGILTLEGPCVRAKLPTPVMADHPGSSTVTFQLWAHKRFETRVTFDTLNDVTEEVFLLWTARLTQEHGDIEIRGLALAVVENDKYRRLGSVSGTHHNQGCHYIMALPHTQVKIV